MTSTLDSEVVARARGMRDLVRAEAAESERLRTLTPAIVDEMWASGLMSVSYTHLTLPTIYSV